MKWLILLIPFIALAQMDFKREKNQYFDEFGRIKSSLLRQGPSSGLNADFIDNLDSWQFLRSTGPATFYGNLGISSSLPRGMLVVGASNTPPLFVGQDGNIGIATTTAVSPLHINGTISVSSGGAINFRNSTATGSRHSLISNPNIFRTVGEQFDLAVDGTQTLGSFEGLLVIWSEQNNDGCLFGVSGPQSGSTEYLDTASICSSTVGTASMINVYIVSNQITVQNKQGSLVTVTATLIGK